MVINATPKKSVQKLQDGNIVGFEKSYSPPGYGIPMPEPIVFYVYDEIGPTADYVEMCHAMLYASEDQEIFIRVNSPGGNLFSGVSIINAIKTSPGIVTTILDGEAASAGAMIWLAGHEKAIASPHVSLMLHGASCGFYQSKTSDITNSTKATDRIVESLLDDLAGPFLTPQERDDIRKGVDIYLTGEDIIERSALLVSEDSEENIED